MNYSFRFILPLSVILLLPPSAACLLHHWKFGSIIALFGSVLAGNVYALSGGHAYW